VCAKEEMAHGKNENATEIRLHQAKRRVYSLSPVKALHPLGHNLHKAWGLGDYKPLCTLPPSMPPSPGASVQHGLSAAIAFLASACALWAADKR